MDDIRIVIHRQSVVHSLVEYVDGSVLAQLGSPDMRTPIAQALGWPQRLDAGVQFLDLVQTARWTSRRRTLHGFPVSGSPSRAARAGGDAPVVLNAANEVAVQAFLDGRLNFGGISRVIGEVMNSSVGLQGTTGLARILEVDAASAAGDRCRPAFVNPAAECRELSLSWQHLLAFLFAVGLLVTVHEFGHYWVARKLGFKVLRFSVGFARRSGSTPAKVPDHTEYVLAAIPLGGYVTAAR